MALDEMAFLRKNSFIALVRTSFALSTLTWPIRYGLTGRCQAELSQISQKWQKKSEKFNKIRIERTSERNEYCVTGNSAKGTHSERAVVAAAAFVYLMAYSHERHHRYVRQRIFVSDSHYYIS